MILTPGQAAKSALTGPDAVRLPGPARAGTAGFLVRGQHQDPAAFPPAAPARTAQTAPRDAAGGPATAAPDDQPGANMIVTHVPSGP